MAAANFRLVEDLFQCSICLDVFKDPVSTPCGHNFCKNCITEHLNIDVPLQCPICRRMFYPKPELQINTLIAEMIDAFSQNGPMERETELQLAEELRNKKSSEVEQFSNAPKLPKGMETPKLLMKDELVKVQHHTIDMTFDPDTAYPGLILSDDGKQVRCCDSRRNLPENPKRFTECAFVLGKQGFSSGRFYFEVQVKGKTKWSIGVAKESVSRKGDIKLCPQNGFWALWMRSRGEYRALAGPSVSVHPRSAFEKVGVFVDYEAGLVSFYDVNNAAHIYSFTGCHFTERLFPFFDPSRNNDGEKISCNPWTPVKITNH
uniref:Uncharacterized protein n=1 Tax=Oryzias latipes TaxID=8090 RepID=A0A3P9JBL0_ORYLA